MQFIATSELKKKNEKKNCRRHVSIETHGNIEIDGYPIPAMLTENKSMADYNCFFLSRAHDRNKGKFSKVIGMDLTAFKEEVTRWRHHWSIRPPDDPLPETLVETLDQTNAAFYSGIYVAVKTIPLLTLFQRALLSTVSAR